jgi:hypothetical protein
MDCSPQANYIDGATVGEVSTKLLRIESFAWLAQRIPAVINLGFIDRNRHFSIKVAPQ